MKKLNYSGFTLVEVTISVAVMGLLLGVIATFSMSALTQSSISGAQANLLGQSQITMDRIISDVRLSAGADDVNRWSDPNKTGGEFSWESNATTLVLANAVVDSANNVIFADPSKYISEKNNVIYFLSNGTLYKRVLASPVINNAAQQTCPSNAVTAVCPADRMLLNNVTSFNVNYLNGDNQTVTPPDARSVELTITTSVKKFGQDIKSDYTTRAVFRND